MTRQEEQKSGVLDHAVHGDEAKFLAYGQLADEIQAIVKAGQQPNVRTLSQKHPELADQIEDLVPALSMLQSIAEEPGEPTEGTSFHGATLGDYRILREVGRGGMGVVYEARQISLERCVALKVLPFAAVLDQKQLNRFKNEAQVAAQLVHQNIVPVHAVGCDRGVHFYAMQYIEGRTLAHVIDDLRSHVETSRDSSGSDSHAQTTKALASAVTVDNETPCKEYASTSSALSSEGLADSRNHFRTIAQLAQQVADALHYAHGEGVIHRDIKPSNLILDRQGKLWITDFGLAHFDSGQSLTMTGDFLGTLRYMSPEQVLAQRVVVDERTDVYSLGITLYELATLQLAFPARDRQELLRQITFEEPRRPRRHKGDIPSDLETIILKATEKNPKDRYHSAGEMSEDLRRFLDDQPLRARRPTLTQIAAKWSRRHRSVVTSLAAAVGITLVAATIVAGVVARREFNNRTKIESQKKRVSKLLAASYMDKGQSLAEKGDIGGGMLWMSHALQILPPQAEELRGALRSSVGAWSRRLHVHDMVFQHGSYVTAVAISPDGRIVLSVGEDGTAKRWNSSTGSRIGEALVHPRKVTDVAISADGEMFLTGCSDGVARIWLLASGREVDQPLNHGDVILATEFSPDGQECFTRSDFGLRVWDVHTREQLFEHTTKSDQRILAAAYTPDGLQFVKRVSNGAQVYRVDGDDAITVSELIKRPSVWVAVDRWWRNFREMCISPNGQHFALCSDNITVFHAKTGHPAGPTIDTAASIYESVLNKDGTRVITAAMDWTARIWDVASGKQIGEPLQHHGWVVAAALSVDESQLVTGSADGTVRLWKLARNDLNSIRLPGPAGIRDISFSPSNSHLGVSGGARSAIIDLATCEIVRLDGGRDLDFNQDGSLVSTSSRPARVWKSANGALVTELEKKQFVNYRAAALSPDGSMILTGSSDHSAQLWDVRTGDPIGTPLTHDNQVLGVDFSPNGELLLTGGFDATARLWDAKSGKLVGHPLQQHGEIKDLAINSDGTCFIVGLANGTGRIWDIEKLMPIGDPLVHRLGVWHVAFSPNGRVVATGSHDRTARIWDAATGKPIGPPLPSGAAIGGIAFSPDGQWFVYGADRGAELYLWRLPTRHVDGDAERIRLWTEVITGLTLLVDSQPVTNVLSAKQWREKKEKLQAIGGVPLTDATSEEKQPVTSRSLVEVLNRIQAKIDSE